MDDEEEVEVEADGQCRGVVKYGVDDHMIRPNSGLW